MQYQVQHFKIAELIFVSNQDSGITLPSERKEIKSRFESIVNGFLDHDKDYNAGFIKNGKSNLPYNSMFVYNNDYIVLNFQNSFYGPIMIVFDLKNHMACNYIDISKMKFIMHDNMYERVKTKLNHPKNMDRLLPNIQNMDSFIRYYSEKIKENTNLKTVTGTNCFEVNLDDFYFR